MQSFMATDVSVPDDIGLDYGESWLAFTWSDQMYGHEGLTIDLDGHCSRRMPIRSGDGPPLVVELQRDRIKLRFPAVLAKKLELDEEIEILFAISDNDFAQLQRTIEYFSEADCP